MNSQRDPSEKPLIRQPVQLPNARLILILGILSILLSWLHLVSVAGLVLGFITLVLANREMLAYHSNPGAYTSQSLNNVRAGRTFALIGIAISAIIVLLLILFLLGIFATLPFWGMIN
jgi:hypothetical protein